MKVSELLGERYKDRVAEIESQNLMVRGGYIKQVGNGIYSLMPPARRIHNKIEAILRQEMDRIDGQEVLFPVTMPATLWQASGRWESVGKELLRFKDRSGADMVLELPDILSLSCAERFALGGVRILSASGIADRLCFGSESGDIDALRRAADSKLSGDELSSALSSGLSYPAAAARQLRAHGIGVGSNNPNDVLGIEYIRALNRIAPAIRPFAVRRIGCGYNENTLPENYASASAVRSALLHLTDSENICRRDVLSAISGSVPPFVLLEIQKQLSEQRAPAALSGLSQAVLYRLRCMTGDELSRIADVSEGLENPILRAAKSASNIAELLDAVKTKRYTLARLKRILFNALLGITREQQELAAYSDDALYIRVLGIRQSKLHLLSELQENAALPIVLRRSDAESLPFNAKQTLELTRRASLIRALACPGNASCRDDFSHRLVII